MAAPARFVNSENCKLYEVNIQEVLSNINMNISIMESLSHFITEPELVRIAGNPRHNLFALLGHLDENFITDIVISFILAGRDTTSAALIWFFWLVSKNPDVETEILKEINEKSEAPIYEEVKDMVYTHASLSETMRLYPPIPIDEKQALKNDVLPDGTIVKKGMRVNYHPYAMGRIVHVFALPDAPEEEYQSTSLKLLTRYYNGHMAQDVVEEVPQREANFLTQLRQKKGRSMVEITCVTIIPLHDYEAHVARHFGNCSFDELFRAFSRIFIGALAYLVIDHFFALRILRRNIELVQQGEPVPAKKPWENLTDEKRIEAFIRGTHQIELVIHLVKEVLHLTDDEILQHMRGVFRDVLDCFNTLSPEVVDEGSSGAVV
ncbi:Cytochrome P450 94A2 [Camellia lanceoleosa]|uniref:Cytochrome P450 94A2 n=1 Tax=Camellia lanceoleosa TaxID=1840588 RepID=A0ACC0IDM1_9ERIC|nr:Cytochrome P450 94A2 [Camellia lanceoleosa]